MGRQAAVSTESVISFQMLPPIPTQLTMDRMHLPLLLLHMCLAHTAGTRRGLQGSTAPEHQSA